MMADNTSRKNGKAEKLCQVSLLTAARYLGRGKDPVIFFPDETGMMYAKQALGEFLTDFLDGCLFFVKEGDIPKATDATQAPIEEL